MPLAPESLLYPLLCQLPLGFCPPAQPTSWGPQRGTPAQAERKDPSLPWDWDSPSLSWDRAADLSRQRPHLAFLSFPHGSPPERVGLCTWPPKITGTMSPRSAPPHSLPPLSHPTSQPSHPKIPAAVVAMVRAPPAPGTSINCNLGTWRYRKRPNVQCAVPAHSRSSHFGIISAN